MWHHGYTRVIDGFEMSAVRLPFGLKTLALSTSVCKAMYKRAVAAAFENLYLLLVKRIVS